MNGSSQIVFELEYTSAIQDEAYVFARLLQPETDFTLTDTALINDIPIKKHVTMPRKLDENGNIRLDIFAFVLKNKNDILKFKDVTKLFLTP